MILRAHAAELARGLRHSAPSRRSRAGGTERSSEFGCVLMCGSPLCVGRPNGAQAARCPGAAHCAAESPRAMHINDTLPRAPSSRLTWRWEKCRMPEERQSVLTASSRAGGLASRPSSISRRVGLDPFRSIAAHEEHCGHGCQRPVRLRTPGPCTYSLQPRAAPHPRSPAAQARRSSPVVAVAASRA